MHRIYIKFLLITLSNVIGQQIFRYFVKTMSKKSSDKTETFLTILLGVLAIFMIKSIFENDNSRIISKKGRKLLSDDKKMEEINKKINLSEDKNEHQEIFV